MPANELAQWSAIKVSRAELVNKSAMRANGRADGPVFTSGFLALLNNGVVFFPANFQGKAFEGGK